jgi:hypothetical protein
VIFALLIVAALAAGYLLGRLRPFDRLDTWVWHQFTFGSTWFDTKPRQAVLLAVHALVRPAATLDIWRHRHDPPPGRGPAPQIADWATTRTDPGEDPSA